MTETPARVWYDPNTGRLQVTMTQHALAHRPEIRHVNIRAEHPGGGHSETTISIPRRETRRMRVREDGDLPEPPSAHVAAFLDAQDRHVSGRMPVATTHAADGTVVELDRDQMRALLTQLEQLRRDLDKARRDAASWQAIAAGRGDAP